MEGALSRNAMRIVVAVLLGAFVAVSAPTTALAAPLKGYEALQVSSSGSGKLTLAPGETKDFTITFKNIGTASWANMGPGYVSVYTYGPKYRASLFQDLSWKSSTQPSVMREQTARAGETGTISFKLKAPKVTGEYQETFNLAAEDVAWIPGGLFTVKIVVAQTPKAELLVVPPTQSPSSPTGLSALTLIRSQKKVLVSKGGDAVTYTVGIKNTGTLAWKRRELRVPSVSAASVRNETMNGSWLSTSVLVANAGADVAPGALEYFTFTFNAPRAAGTHVVKYALVVDDQAVPDYWVDIPVEVTSGSPEAFNVPIVQEIPETFPMQEPMLRVGILIVDGETNNEVKVSCETAWKLMGGDGALLAELPAGKPVTALYKQSRYWFDRGNGFEKTPHFLRFVPNEPNAVCTVENWDRRNRGADRPYNRYRNVLELRYNDAKTRTWLINELPMEWYLKGLGETSNVSHMEYQKALVTAARTYATYHFERGTKRGPEFFHITGYADDQVYRGYDQEANSPRIVRSVEETRGQVVTYEGRTAITPYFSRSAGRTYDWGEVWGGDVPWVKGVACPCDKEKGYNLWGHGIGMSATEALCMANRGQGWEQILHYFYTNIAILKRWK
ncbi:hypothetical protein A2856_00740 [Candidatus Uhrbacteria bacterium RIFCSPHIGHO2_01_FULL_63_20]|uniref:Sporulation stage II protein D amidase enhancer LytB N-terminal domain-containing protein n=1 Tax=Candidatus Uhrbacteria bacterium RIFCSPHIGHO2_01_FULL_63_20 TaxID=1802385 RepID=A0A1F7TLZ4_9BACT|nr:MAG: hypothetical protein A2856_00740 [Candidatus Uhrbacteria bacterium RIFCSPHIGHO2_01_FULL_63_20]